MAYVITEERRNEYRETSRVSRERKRIALENNALEKIHPVNVPQYNPNDFMPQLPRNSCKTLSLFSGGGGLDLGFYKAGFQHIASYEILDICGKTLKNNRPNWEVFYGKEGDVQNVDWSIYKGNIDLIQGGPPCQPFSIAGNQLGAADERNMWPSFIKAIKEIAPRIFVAENVLGLLDPMFSDFLNEVVIKPLEGLYSIHKYILNAADFGVPQIRKRVIFVGFLNTNDYKKYKRPIVTHTKDIGLGIISNSWVGVREALGLDNIGFDCVAPTLRSGFTGPRKTTGVVNSQASMKTWNELKIWPNGVQSSREKASKYPPENKSFRLSVQDCALIQGFPEQWEFEGAVYQILGQIGNSVCPPVAYNIAKSILDIL
jgi:DNA (cytosine-5)-methyltransferase 1